MMMTMMRNYTWLRWPEKKMAEFLVFIIIKTLLLLFCMTHLSLFIIPKMQNKTAKTPSKLSISMNPLNII